MSDYAELSDEELHDMGMYRCDCGETVYPTGLPTQHCALDQVTVTH